MIKSLLIEIEAAFGDKIRANYDNIIALTMIAYAKKVVEIIKLLSYYQ
jgi:hypothetical protein